MTVRAPGLVALALCLGLQAGRVGAETASPPPSGPKEAARGEKLPVNLPPVIVRGEETFSGTLVTGNKLAPDLSSGRLPFPRPPRPGLMLESYLGPAPETASPSIVLPVERPATPTENLGEWSIGTSGPHRYLLGLELGRTLSGTTTGLDQDTLLLGTVKGSLGHAYSASVGDWSRWDADFLAGARPGSTGSITPFRAALRVRSHDTQIGLDGSRASAAAGRLSLSDQAPDWTGHLNLEAGQARASEANADPTRWWDGRLDWTRADAWSLGEQLLSVHADTGTRWNATGNWSGYLRGSLEDRWPAAPGWTIIGNLDLGRATEEWIADPRLTLDYEPRPDTRLTIRSGAWHEFPWWGDLATSRRWSSLDPVLRDVRVRAGAEVSGNQRLDDTWSLDGQVSYAWVDGWLAWRQDPASGLWQPFHAGSGAAGNVGQGVLRGEARATYLAWAGAPHVFGYRFRSVQPLGELWQELSLGHESRWWDDRLELRLSGRAELVELGALQVGTAQAGSQMSMDARISWRVQPGWSTWIEAMAWPVQQRQVAGTYFAPDTLLTLGLSLEF